MFSAYISGLSVDIVRKKAYTKPSRQSLIEFGTAALRDATTNSLFYKVNNQSIDDYTQKGLLDLATGIIRTPLRPYQTFMIDALRVLRLIRFASRFGFESTRRQNSR